MSTIYTQSLFLCFSIGFCALFPLINEIDMSFSINSQFASINRTQMGLVIFKYLMKTNFFFSLTLPCLYFSAFPMVYQTRKKLFFIVLKRKKTNTNIFCEWRIHPTTSVWHSKCPQFAFRIPHVLRFTLFPFLFWSLKLIMYCFVLHNERIYIYIMAFKLFPVNQFLFFFASLTLFHFIITLIFLLFFILHWSSERE